MKRSELKQLIKEEIQKVLKENNAQLAKEASDLYAKAIKMKDQLKHLAVDDQVLDDAMESLVKKAGLTPEQNKIEGAYQFTSVDNHPKFSTLTNEQLSVILEFLKDVVKRVEEGGTFQLGDWDWDNDTFSEEED